MVPDAGVYEIGPAHAQQSYFFAIVPQSKAYAAVDT